LDLTRTIQAGQNLFPWSGTGLSPLLRLSIPFRRTIGRPICFIEVSYHAAAQASPFSGLSFGARLSSILFRTNFYPRRDHLPGPPRIFSRSSVFSHDFSILACHLAAPKLALLPPSPPSGKLLGSTLPLYIVPTSSLALSFYPF